MHARALLLGQTGEAGCRHGLAPFNLTAIFAEQRPADLSRLASEHGGLQGLDGRGPATADVLGRTDRAVAVMGAQPIQSALADGADVIVAGRSADICLFAAPLLNLGFLVRIRRYDFDRELRIIYEGAFD